MENIIKNGKGETLSFHETKHKKEEETLESVATSLADSTSKLNISQIPLDYFKKSNNTWDDALSAAFTYFAAPVAPVQGGIILLGANQYILSPFTMSSRVSIVGLGKGISILQQKAGTTGHFITFTTSSIFSSLKECTVDGNKTNCPSGGDGVYFASRGSVNEVIPELYDKTNNNPSSYTYTTLENVAVVNAKSNGIEISSGVWGSWFRKITVNQNDGNGLVCQTTDNNFESIWAEFNGLSGILETQGNNRWSNIKSIFNGKNDTVNSAGFKLQTTARSMIVNLECQDNYCDGVQILNSNGFVMDNIVVDGNGRINLSDPTDGSFAGNANNTGVRVTNSQHFKIKGSANNYKYPSCYIQNNATIVDTASLDYVIDLVEANQYTTSPTIRNSPGATKIYSGMPVIATYLGYPITNFQINAVTLQRVADGSTSPTGDSTGGTVITYRMDDDLYSYQEYVPHGKTSKYRRAWDKTNSVWMSWSLTTPQLTIPNVSADSGVILTQPLSYFANNSISYYRVNGGSANAPNSSAGVLSTLNISTDSTMSYQEFKIYNTGQKYTRQWNGSAWTSWTTVNNSSGTTANRPTTALYIGMPYFDTTLNKPIWYKGSSVWVDSTGTTV